LSYREFATEAPGANSATFEAMKQRVNLITLGVTNPHWTVTGDGGVQLG
jgi:hypothetical protein